MKRRPDDPSPLWLWLGIPACVLSIAAGIWLLNQEAARRMEQRTTAPTPAPHQDTP